MLLRKVKRQRHEAQQRITDIQHVRKRCDRGQGYEGIVHRARLADDDAGDADASSDAGDYPDWAWE